MEINERRNNCIQKCEYFENCYGGCNANANINQDNNYYDLNEYYNNILVKTKRK